LCCCNCADGLACLLLLLLLQVLGSAADALCVAYNNVWPAVSWHSCTMPCAAAELRCWTSLLLLLQVLGSAADVLGVAYNNVRPAVS
jgi:hypothetical protein